MKTWVRKSLKVGVLSAGIILFAGGTAQAAEWGTSDNEGAQAGNQILSDVDAPVDVCAASAEVLRDASSACAVPDIQVPDVQPGSIGRMSMGGNGGALVDDRIAVPVEELINICGHAMDTVGGTAAGCDAGSSGGHEARRLESLLHHGNDGLLRVCSDTHGLLGNGTAGFNVLGHGPAACDGSDGRGSVHGVPGFIHGVPGFSQCGAVSPQCGGAIDDATDDLNNGVGDIVSGDTSDDTSDDTSGDAGDIVSGDTSGDTSGDAGDIVSGGGIGGDTDDDVSGGNAGGDIGGDSDDDASDVGGDDAGGANIGGDNAGTSYGQGAGYGGSDRCGITSTLPVFHSLHGLTRLSAVVPL